jgi:hypothetical protein
MQAVRLRRWALIVWLAAIGLMSGTHQVSGSSAGDAAGIEAFVGSWIGATMPGAEVKRVGTVLIERLGPAGFAVTWTSYEGVERPEGRNTIKRDRRLVFEPSPLAGVWRAAPAASPIGGEAAWATIGQRQFTVTVIAVTEDGALERQVYERSLSGEGHRLVYRRFVDEMLERTLHAQFLRQ